MRAITPVNARWAARWFVLALLAPLALVASQATFAPARAAAATSPRAYVANSGRIACLRGHDRRLLPRIAAFVSITHDLS